MRSVMSVHMLCVLAVVLLASSLCEGRILNKCELMTLLDSNSTGNGTGNVNVTGNFTGNATGGSASNLTASIVCSVERTSKFNTSLVTTLMPPIMPTQQPIQPNKRPGKGSGEDNARHDIKIRHRRSRGGKSNTNDDSSEQPVPVFLTQLFGIFQLSNRVACVSGSEPSLDLCHMSCNSLLDDDITDDVECLEVVLKSLGSTMVSVPECRAVDPAQYFASCL